MAEIKVAVKAVTDQIPEILGRLKELEKTDDEKIAALVRARNHRPGPGQHVASQADGSTLKKGDEGYEAAVKGPNILDQAMAGLEVDEPPAQ